MRALYRYALLAFVVLPSSFAIVHAQSSYSVTVDRPTRTLDTMAFTTFEIRVRSLSDDTLRVRMARAVNDLPDTSWHTSICSITTCYTEEVSLTEPETLEPRGETGFTVHVYTGSGLGDTARILVRLELADGSDTASHLLTIVTAAPERRLFRVEPDAMRRSIAAGDTARFTIWAFNESGDTLSVAAARIDDFYPDATWSSRLCVESTCYDPEVAAPAGVQLDVDRATWFTLLVTGRTPGQARVVLRVNSARGTEPVEHRFTVDMLASGIDRERDARRATVTPLPARDLVTIALGERAAGRELLVEVAAADGARALAERLRADREGRLRLDVGSLATGVYRFVVDAGAAGSGGFVVIR